jgi:hypothetical protein
VDNESPGGAASNYRAGHRDFEFNAGGYEAFTVLSPAMLTISENGRDSFDGNKRVFLNINQKAEGTCTAKLRGEVESGSVRGLSDVFINHEGIVESTVDDNLLAMS